MFFDETHTSVKVPEEIENLMKLYRMGMMPIPQEYIEWHRELAEKDLIKFAYRNGLTIYYQTMVQDGWCDNMMFLQAIIEDRHTNTLMKIRWTDGQAWFKQTPNGGWVRL